eukprot:SAG31_NODE_150_length_22290_cov_5.975801_9_plen_63_part_00
MHVQAEANLNYWELMTLCIDLAAKAKYTAFLDKKRKSPFVAEPNPFRTEGQLSNFNCDDYRA